jgi:hypothetical protein
MKCNKTATEIATQNTDELNSITNNLKNSLLNDPPEIELVLFSFVVEFVISILHKKFGKKKLFSTSQFVEASHKQSIRPGRLR